MFTRYNFPIDVSEQISVPTLASKFFDLYKRCSTIIVQSIFLKNHLILLLYSLIGGIQIFYFFVIIDICKVCVRNSDTFCHKFWLELQWNNKTFIANNAQIMAHPIHNLCNFSDINLFTLFIVIQTWIQVNS